MTPTRERRRPGALNSIRRGYRARRFYLATNAWGVFIGTLAVTTSLLFFFLPAADLGGAAVGQRLGDVAYLWNALYLAAGAMVLYGLVKPHNPTDAAGLTLLATATSIQLGTILATYGWSGLTVVPSLGGVILASIARVRVLTGQLR